MNAKLTALDKNAKLKAFRAPKALEIGRIHTLSRAVNNSAFNRNATQYYASGAGLRAVQGVRSCSYPECMLLKCELPAAKGYIEGFVANAPHKTNLTLEIEQNFALVTAMIKAHPCLKSDFQVYLRNDGAVLNIDLDRCKRSSEKECSDTRCRRSQEKMRQLKMDRDIYLANETITLTTQPLELTCRKGGAQVA